MGRTPTNAPGARRARGFTLVEILVSVAALALALMAAYSAQLSGMRLSNFSKESDVATFGCTSAIEMVTARPFMEMIDPDPVSGSVDPDELAALQPPYDPRGFATYAANAAKYPDAPTADYVSEDAALYNKVLSYGVRIWEPVQQPQLKTDPATATSYMLYPLGTLQRAKVITWFEPRPTLLDGVASPLNKTNALGFKALVPQLADVSDIASAVPTTVVVALGWFPTTSVHDAASTQFNPLTLFVPPTGATPFTLGEVATLKQRRDLLRAAGVRIQYHRTVVKP